MKQTPNFKLNKPELQDVVNIEDFNENADLIDAALKEREKTTDVNTKVTNAKNELYAWVRKYGLGNNPTNTISSGGDLNSYIDSGFYRLNGDNFLNQPASVGYSQMLVIRGGGDTVTQVIFTYNDSGKVWVRSGNPLNSSGGKWNGWVTMASVPVVDAKIKAHTDLTNNPHNVTTEQVNVIDTKKSTDSPNTYPSGASTFQVNNNEFAVGYPDALGVATTFKHNQERTLQFFASKDGKLWTRTADSNGTNGWLTWVRIETEANSQAKANKALSDAKDYADGHLETAKADATTKANAAEKAAKDASLPKVGGNMSGMVVFGSGQKVAGTTPSSASPTQGIQFAFDTDYFKLFGREDTTQETSGLILQMSDNTDEYFQIEAVAPSGSTPIPLFTVSAARGVRVNTNLYENDKRVATQDFATDEAEKIRTWAKGLGLGQAAVSASDLNNINQSGFYYSQTNTPGSGTWFGVHVQHGSAYAYQMFGRNGQFWSRTNENNAWTAWVRLETTDGAQAKANTAQSNAEANAKAFVNNYGLGYEAKEIRDNINMSMYTGFYRFNRAYAEVTNAPSQGANEHSWMYMLHIRHSGTYQLQVTWDFNNKASYSRTLMNGTWGAWVKSETDDGAQTKANAVKDSSVQKTGSTMTGPLGFNTTDPTPIQARRTGNGSNANFRLQHDAATGYIGIDRNGKWKIDTGNDANLDGNTTAQYIETTEGAQLKATQAKNDALTAMNRIGIGTSTTPQVTDLDVLVVQGYYYFRGSATGAPRDAGGVVHHIPSSGTNYAIQIAYLDATNTVLQRTKRNGTWSSWLQTAGNMQEGWRDLTPYGGAQPYNSSNGPQVMRVGDLVFLRGALTNITSRNQTVLTLPGDCRPSRDWQFVSNISIGGGYTARVARWNIQTGGSVIMDYTVDNSFDANWWSLNTVFSMGG